MNTQLAQPQTHTDAQDGTQMPRSYAITFGRQDAAHGATCLPELYFANRVDKLDYVRGYESVAGETLLSRQVKDLMGITS